MDRWRVKYVVKHLFGGTPWGVAVYDWLTAGVLGTQRALPAKWCFWFREHLLLIRRHCRLDFANVPIWCVDVGTTLTPGILARVVSEGPVLMTDHRRRLRGRYTAAALAVVKQNLGAIRTWARACGAAGEVIAALRGAQGGQTLMDRLGARYIAPLQPGRLEVEDASVGLCISMGALEHYAPHSLERLIADMARVLRPGGVVSHIVDHRDHLYHFDQTKDCFYHLRFSDDQWRRMANSPLLHLNRLLRSDYLRLFEQAGFEVRYAGYSLHERDTLAVRRDRLWGRYADAPAEDLRAAVTHFVAVRR